MVWPENHIMHNLRCPDCGGAVTYEPDCPGYGDPVMVCSPCGNAELYECCGTQDGDYEDSCGWWHRNPNKRSDTNGCGKKMGRPPVSLGE